MRLNHSKVSRYCHDHPPKSIPWNKERQDLSGHVCFDNELYEFYRTSELRANRIERARMDGTLKIQPSRNPLRAEKTPRKEFHLPPSSTLLNAKNSDNLSIVDEEKHRSLSNHDINAQSLSEFPNTRKESEISEHPEQGIPPLKADEASLPNRRTLGVPRVDVKKIEYDMLNTTISDFRKRVGEDPLLLAKWRAEKAAEYISKHGVAVPEPRIDDRKSFSHYGRSSTKRPMEKMQIKGRTTETTTGSLPGNVSKGDVLRSINYLRQKLVDTEREIERQELRLALHTRTKHYELPVGRFRRGSSP